MSQGMGPFLTIATKWTALGAVLWLAVGLTFVTCAPDPGSPGSGTGGAASNPANVGGTTQPRGSGGATGSGGMSASGGSGTGGQVTTGSGGSTSTGGRGSGGAATGGNGGRANGGGGSTGGAATGGSGTGGAGTGGMGTGGAGVGGTTHTGVWKVMLLGDSVTGTCYPQVLSRDLIAGGHTNFQFMGTSTNNCGNGTPSVKTEAHGGYGVTYLPSTSTRPQCTKQAQGCGTFAELQTWAAEKPDMVLMHFATNDCWDGQPTATILAAYVAVINEFRKQNPNVIFFVSKIIPLVPAPTNAINLNAAVTPAWASTNATATSPVYIIDHWTGFNDATDTSEGVHPNAAGAQKMATASFNALAAAGYF